MAVKSSEHTESMSRFRASLSRWIDNSGKTKTQVSELLGISQGNFSNILNGKKSVSLAIMEDIAGKLGADLLDLLTEGRAILAGEVLELAQAPLEVEIKPERETELLRKLEIANDEARKWRLRAEELERGLLPPSSSIDATGTALSAGILDGSNFTGSKSMEEQSNKE